MVRWLPWAAAIVFVVALGSVLAVVFGSGDDATDVPASIDGPVPTLADIDPHASPEVPAGRGGVVVPTLAEIDPHMSPEVLGRTVGVAEARPEIDPHVSPEALG